PELQLVGFTAQSQSENLMAKANPKNRLLPQHMTDALNRVFERLRIAWPIRQKDAFGLKRHHVFAGSRRRHDRDARATPREIAEDVRLDAEIVGDDVKCIRLEIRECGKLDEVDVLVRVVITLVDGDNGRKIETDHLRRPMNFLA